MRPFYEVLERYDNLWEQAEAFVGAYFAEHQRQRSSEEDATESNGQFLFVEVPDLKELNTAITILKRIQDARRAIHLDAIKLEVTPPDGRKADAIDPEKISRILERLESNGDGSEPEALDEDAV